MADLIAKSPCDGLLPLSFDTVSLTELTPAAITSFAALNSADPDAFKSATGAAFPAPGRSTGREGARAIWTAPDQCFWLGEAPGDLPGYARTDQTDAWAVIRIEGAGATDVLARLTPIDLRAGSFKRGHTARTLLGHMTASITRTRDDAFDIMVFRSMAATAVHELDRAARQIEARAGLG